MNQTEMAITNIYHSINLFNTSVFTKEDIAERLSIKLRYWSHSSAIATHNNKCYMFIDDRISEQRQWQHFGHEMYHYFHDETSYALLNESYATYGETKADYFSYHFCVPTFMLLQIKGVDVYDVMELFNVEFNFALRRLEMYQSKVIERSNKYAWSYK